MVVLQLTISHLGDDGEKRILDLREVWLAFQPLFGAVEHWPFRLRGLFFSGH
ncbi:hypothetical protein D3C77_793060 [compost metagenome]